MLQARFLFLSTDPGCFFESCKIKPAKAVIWKTSNWCREYITGDSFWKGSFVFCSSADNQFVSRDVKRIALYNDADSVICKYKDFGKYRAVFWFYCITGGTKGQQDIYIQGIGPNLLNFEKFLKIFKILQKIKFAKTMIWETSNWCREYITGNNFWQGESSSFVFFSSADNQFVPRHVNMLTLCNDATKYNMQNKTCDQKIQEF